MADSDNLYHAILDNLYDGVYFVDRERKITYWNKGAERITGYSAGEVIGIRCSDNILMHVDTRGTLLCKDLCPLAATLLDGANALTTCTSGIRTANGSPSTSGSPRSGTSAARSQEASRCSPATPRRFPPSPA